MIKYLPSDLPLGVFMLREPQRHSPLWRKACFFVETEMTKVFGRLLSVFDKTQGIPHFFVFVDHYIQLKLKIYKWQTNFTLSPRVWPRKGCRIVRKTTFFSVKGYCNSWIINSYKNTTSLSVVFLCLSQFHFNERNLLHWVLIVVCWDKVHLNSEKTVMTPSPCSSAQANFMERFQK